MLLGGVDEAGRGCILGPLAVAGVSVEAERLGELAGLGVKDSKLLTAKQRESLYPEIARVCRRVEVSRIPPRVIDLYVTRGKRHRKLNYLETIHMARVVEALAVDEVFIDAPDANPRRFTEELEQMLTRRPRIVAQHKADLNYAVVSAASIVAKVERDRDVAALREEHGDFGSGYPSDPDTIAFLEAWMRSNAEQPEFARKSWKTWQRIDRPPTLD
ncbi:MAG: ribonuclease HII [Nitrososphaerota archaeon]|nr:ribonuclease HII [Nitrososphaerota archaeon]